MIKSILGILLCLYAPNAWSNKNITIYGAESRLGSSVQYILTGCLTDRIHTRWLPSISTCSLEQLKLMRHVTLIDKNAIHENAIRSGLVKVDFSHLKENHKYIYNISKHGKGFKIWLEDVDTRIMMSAKYPIELKGLNVDGSMKTSETCESKETKSTKVSES